MQAKWPIRATRSISTPDGMLVYHRVILIIKFPITHYTLGWRGTVKVKCLTQKHNSMSPAMALDLPQVDCKSEGFSRKRGTKLRVNLFRMRNIEFNLHSVGAKKTGCDINIRQPEPK